MMEGQERQDANVTPGVIGSKAQVHGPTTAAGATPSPAAIDAQVQVHQPSISTEVLWNTASLTFAAVLYTAAITILGVLVAPLAFLPWRLVYAGVAVVLLILGVTVFKGPVIRFSGRVIGKLAP